MPLSWVPLTAVPQRTALSHAFGGLAAGLVGTAKYMIWFQHGELTRFRTGAIVLEIILGYLTFTGSLMAAGKLQEIVPTRPITYPNQNFDQPGTAGDRDRRRRLPDHRPLPAVGVRAHHPAVARSSACC